MNYEELTDYEKIKLILENYPALKDRLNYLKANIDNVSLKHSYSYDRTAKGFNSKYLSDIEKIEDIKEKSNNVDISINEINKKIEELKKYIENSEKRGIIDIKEIFKEVLLNYQSNNRMKLKKILPLLINRIEFVNDFRFKIILNI